MLHNLTSLKFVNARKKHRTRYVFILAYFNFTLEEKLAECSFKIPRFIFALSSHYSQWVYCSFADCWKWSSHTKSVGRNSLSKPGNFNLTDLQQGSILGQLYHISFFRDLYSFFVPEYEVRPRFTLGFYGRAWLAWPSIRSQRSRWQEQEVSQILS